MRRKGIKEEGKGRKKGRRRKSRREENITFSFLRLLLCKSSPINLSANVSPLAIVSLDNLTHIIIR
jgi:hypothetical protein